MAVENQNILNNKEKVDQSQIDVRGLEASLLSESKKESSSEDSQEKLKKIIQELVSLNLPVADMEAILIKLPIDKRMQVEKIISESQGTLTATRSPENYKQYLQSQFPTGIPANVGEIALAMVTDTSEMYTTARAEIANMSLAQNASEHEKDMQRREKRIATAALQTAEKQTSGLTQQLA